jgi:4-hydroxybenzoate polyprenyltransferase
MGTEHSHSVFWALLAMARPANILTAHADILAGYAAAETVQFSHLVLLLIATSGLYGGGIVWNDVCDAGQDASERPERPIPRGVVSRTQAAVFGGLLLLGGVVTAFYASKTSGLVALGTALAALFYDAVAKHQAILGPLSMGLCRGLNFSLGLSVSPHALSSRWPIALIATFYIAGITALSRSEVRGGERGAAVVSTFWLTGALLVTFLMFTFVAPHPYWGLPFVALLLYRISPAFLRAIRTLRASDVRLAVKAGVLSLIVLNASVAADFAGFLYGAALLLLYIPAALLARWFAVT